MHVGKRGRLGVVLLALATAGCRESAPVERLSSVRDTLDSIGMRLSRIKSERELTAAATREDALLAWLTPSERATLGRNTVRFRTDVPVQVAIAAPIQSTPFWVVDQGFRETDLTVQIDGRSWRLHHRGFPAGWVGLGINGLDRAADSHYVAFVRSLSTDAPLAPEAVELLPDEPETWSLTAAVEGVSAARDVVRPIRELPAELAGSILLQPSHDRRHSGTLADGRVWKTHSPSTARPDQVVLSFGADAARQLVWSWRTKPGVAGTALRIAPAQHKTPEDDPSSTPDLDGLRIIPGESTPLRSPNLLNDPVVLRHTVAVDDLNPETTYYYSVGDGSPKGWGPWRTVTTGPDRRKRLEFLYLGDAQTGFQEWGELLNSAMKRHPGLDAILLAGDLVDRGNERTNWDHFFLRAAPVFDRIPLMPAVGNHEYLDRGPRLYNALFRLPNNGPRDATPGLAYSFEYGSTFFAVLDSTPAVWSQEQAIQQAEWLDEALTRSTADWKFVMFHHPIYPSHPVRDNPIIREHWVPIFDRHHVDVVLQGHDHAYLRTPPMRANQRVSTFAEGTTYVVAVSGDKFVEDQPHRDYIEVGRTKLSTYQTIEIDEPNARLTYRAWTASGEVADSFVIQKPAPTSLFVDEPIDEEVRRVAGSDEMNELR